MRKPVSGLSVVALATATALALTGCVAGKSGPDGPPSPVPATGAAGQNASAAASLPDLPAETAAFLNPTAIVPTHVGKLIGYRVTLTGGWGMLAVQGAPAAVVPTVLQDPTYHGKTSGLYQSGPYVLFFPDLTTAPTAFTQATKKPGMTSIDPAAYK